MIPQIGFQQPFLLHGILCLTCLHLACITPDDKERHKLDASRYHNQAIQGFRESISEIDKGENNDALFAWASLNIICVFAMSGMQLHKRPSGENDALSAAQRSQVLGAEWIPMIRGVQAVLKHVYERVRHGPLQSLTNVENWEEIDPDQQPFECDEHFRNCKEVWAKSSDAQLYDDTLYLLRKCNAFMRQFKNMEGVILREWSYNRIWSAPFIWLHATTEEFFLHLRQRQPPALIIFAYFGALLHELNSYWFLEGWGLSIVKVVDEILGDYWTIWTKWPKEAIGLV